MKKNNTKKCSFCGNNMYDMDNENGTVYKCLKCNKSFVNIDGKEFEIILNIDNNSNYENDLNPFSSEVNDSKLKINFSIYKTKNTPEEQADEELSNKITEFYQNHKIKHYKALKNGKDYYIFGDICGIYITKRQENDNHIIFKFISQDDGFWYVMNDSSFSSYWIEDFEKVIAAAKKFFNTKEKDIYDGIAYGWKF